ncbi:MAG: hypothetical protein JWO03_1495 [Bacteroidetes bacterium]|nr:hypothetical protein [Bacteroidota bacterium]
MKRILLILAFSPLAAFAQTSVLHSFTNVDFNTTYAIGAIAELPDTITIFTNEAQLKPEQNYTKLKKIRSGIYQLWYWEVERGGIIDPVLYKYDLKIKLKKNDEMELAFHDKKRIYYIKGLKTKEGLRYELTGK